MAIDSKNLLEMARRAGFELAGVCDVVSPPNHAHYENWIQKGFHGEMQYLAGHLIQKRNPQTLLPSAKSILAVGLNYYQPNASMSGTVRIARYALGRDYHKVVRGKLKHLGLQLSKTYTNLQYRICVDSAPILERDFAQLAGLGWYGKNTMLINSERGSWFVIGTLLLSQHFEPSKPAIGGCGTCKKCIEACPTGAIVPINGTWQIDARECISYKTIELKGEIPIDKSHPIEDWTFGCDVCQEVCPFNKTRASQPHRATITQEPDFIRKIASKTLAELQEMSKEDWDDWTRGSPLRRAGYDGIRRNARLNLAAIEQERGEPREGLK